MKQCPWSFYFLSVIGVFLLCIIYRPFHTCPVCPEIREVEPHLQAAPKDIPPVQKTAVSPVTVKPHLVKTVRPKPEVQPSPQQEPPFEEAPDFDPDDHLMGELYTNRYYEQTYEDSAMRITVKNKCFGNEIDSQTVTYFRKLPDHVFLMDSVKKRNILFVGAHLSAGTGGFYDVGPNVAIMNKKQQIVFASYNLRDASRLNGSVGALLPIRLRKR